MADKLTTFEVSRYAVVNQVLLIDAEDEESARRQASHANPRTARTQYEETVEVESVRDIRS